MTRAQKADIDERQKWTDVLLTNIGPRFDHRVRRQDELGTDETPDYRDDYTYYSHCNAPRTTGVDEGFPPAAPALLMSTTEC